VGGRLEGRRAIVTGAGNGIGRAAALKIAAEGACVGCLDVNQVAAAETATAIADAAGTAVALAADVADEAQVERAVTKAEETFGGLDTVVANAGILLAGQDDRADRLDVGVWRRVLDVNLTGMFLTCKHGIRACCAGTPVRWCARHPRPACMGWRLALMPTAPARRACTGSSASSPTTTRPRGSG
jgi:NAD(P)-dependent dehydrogenase (short-subunit alcohol dehydrogenase family)